MVSPHRQRGDRMKNTITFKISLCAVFSALALISFTLENLIPPIVIPGARIGVSNVFILLCTITLGAGYGAVALIIKCVLGSIFNGNPSAILYSLPAGALSLSIQTVLLYTTKRISVIAVSVSGGVINNTVQNTVFCLITKTHEYFIYLPYLTLIGALSGAIVGLTVYLLVKKLPKNIFPSTTLTKTNNKEN